MSSNIHGDSIQRFTYDWLVRFCELHPFRKYDFELTNNDRCVPPASRYSNISPSFASLVDKYMPIFYNSHMRCLDNDGIQAFSSSLPNKVVVIMDGVNFSHLLTEAISNFINWPIGFYQMRVEIRYSTIHPKELMKVLKDCESVYVTESTSTEPVLFSQIWPLLRYCDSAYLDLKNLVYDNKMADVFANSISCRKELFLPHFKVCEKAVWAFVKKFLATSDVYCSFMFEPGFTHSAFEKVAQTVEAKLIAGGYKIDKDDKEQVTSYCGRSFSIYKAKNRKIFVRYLEVENFSYPL